MSAFWDHAQPEQPGINGIRYAAKLVHVYYTATAKKLFMRVQVNPDTLDAVREPEHVSAGAWRTISASMRTPELLT